MDDAILWVVCNKTYNFSLYIDSLVLYYEKSHVLILRYLLVMPYPSEVN